MLDVSHHGPPHSYLPGVKNQCLSMISVKITRKMLIRESAPRAFCPVRQRIATAPSTAAAAKQRPSGSPGKILRWTIVLPFLGG